MEAQTAADRVVEALRAEGLLPSGAEERSRAVVARALGARRPAAQSGMSRLVEVVAYLGGALVLSAGFLFLATTWNDLSDTVQVVAVAVVAAVLAAAGVVAVDRDHPDNEVRRRLGGTLLTGAAASAAFAVGLAVQVSSDHHFGNVYWPGVIGSLVGVVLSAAAYRWCSTAVGLVAMLGGALSAAFNVSGSINGDEALYVGLASFVIALVWVVLTEAGVFVERTIARALGVAVALFGAQVASFTGSESWIGYLLFAVLAGCGVWLYLVRLDWPYLALAVLAVTLVVPEVVSDWTNGSLGVVGGVLVAGVTLLAASFAGYRLRREATD